MKKIILGMLIVGISIYLLFSYFFGDVQINKYSNIDAVKNQQAIKHGWIPAILPHSAYEIRETHDIDTNELFGSFKYKEKDENSFMKHLSKNNHGILQWGDFLFKIDEKQKYVTFRNKLK